MTDDAMFLLDGSLYRDYAPRIEPILTDVDALLAATKSKGTDTPTCKSKGTNAPVCPKTSDPTCRPKGTNEPGCPSSDPMCKPKGTNSHCAKTSDPTCPKGTNEPGCPSSDPMCKPKGTNSHCAKTSDPTCSPKGTDDNPICQKPPQGTDGCPKGTDYKGCRKAKPADAPFRQGFAQVPGWQSPPAF